jgi:hypothetical protein
LPIRVTRLRLRRITSVQWCGTRKLYVASRKQPKICVVNQSSLEFLDTIQLPAGEGHQLAVVP